MNELTRLLAGASAVAAIAVLTSSTAQLQDRREVLTLAAGGVSSLAALRETDALVDQLRRDRSLRLAASTDDPLVPGRTHDRFRQYHDGVPIFGAEVTRQSARGATISVFGTLHLGVDVDTTSVLSVDEAAQIIERLAGAPRGGTTTPELVILPDRERTDVYRLVYEARAFTGTQLMAYFIDASSGALVWAYDDLKTQQPVLPCTQCAIGEGLGVNGDQKKISVTTVGGAFLAHYQLRPSDIFTFDMRGDILRTLDVLNGTEQLFDADLATDTDNQWLDGASVDAHVGMGLTYNYLSLRFGRQSLNDEDVRLIGIVHPVDRADLLTAPAELVSLYNLNAFYCGLCGPDGAGLTVFGEGLPPNVLVGGQQYNFFSGALDIVAHELAHGVTDFTSALLFMDESGALNEAFSDIIGVVPEQRQARRLPDRRRRHRAGRHQSTRGSAPVWRPGPLQPQVHGDGGQRWSAHQLAHRDPRLLPGHRRGHSPGLWTDGDRCGPGEPRADRADLLSRVHGANDSRRRLRGGAGRHDPGSARPVRRRQPGGAGRHPGLDLGGREVASARISVISTVDDIQGSLPVTRRNSTAWRRVAVLIVSLVAGLAGEARDAMAQPVPSVRIAVRIDVGERPASRTFAGTRVFTVFSEQGSFEAAYEIEKGGIVDGGISFLLWRNLAMRQDQRGPGDLGASPPVLLRPPAHHERCRRRPGAAGVGRARPGAVGVPARGLAGPVAVGRTQPDQRATGSRRDRPAHRDRVPIRSDRL